MKPAVISAIMMIIAGSLCLLIAISVVNGEPRTFSLMVGMVLGFSLSAVILGAAHLIAEAFSPNDLPSNGVEVTSSGH